MKRSGTAALLACALLLAGRPGQAADNLDSPNLLVRTNSAYDGGDYPLAAQGYETLLARGADSGWLYYNLGNCYLRQGALGRAIGAYRRAEIRLPRQSDVRANLRFARQQGRDALAPAEPPQLLRTLLFWHYGLNYHELTLASALFNGLFWSLAGLARWKRESELLRWGAVAAGFLLCVVFTSMVWRRALPQEIAVVNLPEIDVHSGTNADTVVRFKLHEGTEAHVLDTEEAWLRIELADGKQGWVSAIDVTKLTL